MEIVERILSHAIYNNEPLTEDFEDFVNILVHKLKFVSEENRPQVCIIDQQDGVLAIEKPEFKDVLEVAGGRICTDIQDAEKILFIQHNGALYPQLSQWMGDSAFIASTAFKNNEVYIINNKETIHPKTANDLQVKLEVLSEIIQPTYFMFGRENDFWVKFEVN